MLAMLLSVARRAVASGNASVASEMRACACNE